MEKQYGNNLSDDVRNKKQYVELMEGIGVI